MDPDPVAPQADSVVPASVTEVVRAHLRDIPDFPEPGVVFKDFTPLLADPTAMATVVRDVAGRWRGQADVVVGIEARGFILGGAVAYELGVGFVPVRKAGKLPGPTHHAEYQLEYGSAAIEVHTDAVAEGDRVLVLDDVLATGGTAAATCALLERAGARVAGFEAVIELGFLHGRERLTGHRTHTMLVV
jgi:adenine phosphoribosyltransferase